MTAPRIEQLLFDIAKAVEGLDEEALGPWLSGYITAVHTALAAKPEPKPVAKKAAAKKAAQ